MRIDGTPFRTIWVDDDGWSVRVIDQTRLPWSLDFLRLQDLNAAAHAIRSMQVRGAPLIGAAAAYGLALALRADPGTDAMERAAEQLAATRPTAINLRWALDRMLTRLRNTAVAARAAAAYAEAAAIAEEDVATNAAIGRHGAPLIQQAAAAKAASAKPARPSTSSPIATPAGWPRWTGAPPWRRSTPRTTPASRSMSGWTRRARATRARP